MFRTINEAQSLWFLIVYVASLIAIAFGLDEAFMSILHFTLFAASVTRCALHDTFGASHKSTTRTSASPTSSKQTKGSNSTATFSSSSSSGGGSASPSRRRSAAWVPPCGQGGIPRLPTPLPPVTPPPQKAARPPVAPEPAAQPHIAPAEVAQSLEKARWRKHYDEQVAKEAAMRLKLDEKAKRAEEELARVRAARAVEIALKSEAKARRADEIKAQHGVRTEAQLRRRTEAASGKKIARQRSWAKSP